MRCVLSVRVATALLLLLVLIQPAAAMHSNTTTNLFPDDSDSPPPQQQQQQTSHTMKDVVHWVLASSPRDEVLRHVEERVHRTTSLDRDDSEPMQAHLENSIILARLAGHTLEARVAWLESNVSSLQGNIEQLNATHAAEHKAQSNLITELKGLIEQQNATHTAEMTQLRNEFADLKAQQ